MRLYRIVLLCLTSLVASTGAWAAQSRPNIVLIMTDDLGWADLTSYGAPDIRTPNIDSLGRDAFDLMVLDLDMPRLAGYEVLSHVRRQIPTAMLPVIVLTGTLNPNAEIEVMERGADDYLTKPIDAARLLARVKAALRRARG